MEEEEIIEKVIVYDDPLFVEVEETYPVRQTSSFHEDDDSENEEEEDREVRLSVCVLVAEVNVSALKRIKIFYLNRRQQLRKKTATHRTLTTMI